MLTRRHDMPWGAQMAGQGVRFRLWAPDCKQVGLCIDGEKKKKVLRMNPLDGTGNTLLIDDSYTADPEAALSALEWLKAVTDDHHRGLAGVRIVHEDRE